MYAALYMGMMAADSELTKQLCHMIPLSTQKLYKIQINLEEIQINWNKIGIGSEQSKLTVVLLLEEGSRMA